MPLRFVLAPAGAGKTYHCLTRLRQALEQDPLGPPLLFILPEQATFIHERMLARVAPGGGFSRAEVTSFNRLLRRLPRQAAALPGLSEAGKLLLAASALADCREDLQIFANQAGNSGFAAYLTSAAEELQAYQISPAALSQAAERLGNARLGEIACLYQAYRQGQDGRFASHAQGLAELAQAIEAGLLQDAWVYIDGYGEFTPAERQVVAALMGHTRGLEIMLPLDPDQAEQALQEDAVFYPAWHEYAALSELARRQGAEVLEPLCLRGEPGRFSQNPELQAVERHFSGAGAAAFRDKPLSIRLIQAADRRAELEWAGREIIRLTREEGLSYRDISVLTRDSAPYAYLLPAVFGELGIPYFIDSKKPLLYHPLVELLRSALEVWAYQAHYRHIFRFLKNSLNPVAGPEADALDNYCLAHGLRFWDWAKESWDFPPLAGESPDLAGEMAALKTKGARPLLEFCASLGREAAFSQVRQGLLALLDQLAVWQRLAELESRALAEGQAERAAYHRQAGEKLTNLLEEAEQLLGDRVYPAAQLFQLLEAALSGLSLSTIPPGRDQVFIASLERSRNPEIKAAFLLTVNEGQLPRKAANDGLFSDEDRRALARLGLGLGPDLALRQFRENYLAYVALTRSGQRLYLSYALQEDDGSLLSPSPLVRQLRRLFPALETEDGGEIGPAHLAGGGADLALTAAAWRDGDQAPLWQAVRAHYGEAAGLGLALARVEQGLGFQPETRPLSGALLKRLYGSTLRGSVSRLERYRRCPFSYFAAYGLKLSPRREYKFQAADRGQLFHDILAELGRSLQAQGLDWAELQREQAEALVDQHLAPYLPRFLSGMLLSSARYAYVRGRLRDALVATALLLAESLRQGDFRPVAFELPFGSDEPGSLPAFRIPLSEGKTLELYGRIDRVDAAQANDGRRAFFRVVDYKTGEISLKAEDIQAGLRLQLLIYLQVTLANHDFFTPGREALAAGAFYAPVKDEIVSLAGPPPAARPEGLKMGGLTVLDQESVLLQDRQINGQSKVIPVALAGERFYENSPGLDRETWEELNQRLTELVRESAEAMLSGLVAVAPLRDQGSDACAYCDYHSVCGLEREATAPRKRQDPLLSDGGRP